MSFVSPQYEPPFSSVFDQDPFDKKPPLLSSDSDDLFSGVRQDFARIFYDNNLDTFANAIDFGLPDKLDPMSTKFEVPVPKNPVIGYANNTNPVPQKEIGAGNIFSGASNGSFLVNTMIPKFQEDQSNQSESGKGLAKKEILRFDDFLDSFAEEPLSNMWNNGPAKVVKDHKEQNFTQNNKDAIGFASNGYQKPNRHQGIQEQLYRENYLADILSSLHLGQSLGFGKSDWELQNGKRLEHKKSLDIDKNPIETAQTKLNKKDGKKELKKKMSRDSNDEDSPEDLGIEKGRSLKGLRVLSLRVKNIVIQKKKTTYKEVADLLVKEIASQSKTDSQPDNKDEQNVKRRVYDALNVLIATGILQKEGKLVTCSNNQLPATTSLIKDNAIRSGPWGLTLMNARKRKEAKSETLNELLYKTLALKNLIKRNKENNLNHLPNQNSYPSLNFQKINSPDSMPSNAGTIKFPFLVIDSLTPQNSINLDLDVTQKQLSIESTNSLNVSGDIDVLLKMKLHNVSKSFFNEHIPKALQKHVPKSFLENLS